VLHAEQRVLHLQLEGDGGITRPAEEEPVGRQMDNPAPRRQALERGLAGHGIGERDVMGVTGSGARDRVCRAPGAEDLGNLAARPR